jgi:hypothetical protein
MTQKPDQYQIVQDFRLRRGRQLLAIAAAMLLIFFLALIHHRSDLFGHIAKNTIFSMQLIVIAAFAGFTAVNWRCPSCKKYLGRNINKPGCEKCGTRFG